MNMDLVERLIALVEGSRVTELTYAEGATHVRIVRPNGARTALKPGADAPVERSVEEAPALGALQLSAPLGHSVAAGMIGTFFRAPGPGQAPFVEEGDRVREGQTLGILEAMKMLNPVEADRAGRILRILVEDGVPVEAGTPLFIMTLPG